MHLKEVINLTKYREILRLHSLGFSQQNIAYSSNVSKKTVNRVINRAKELNILWPLDDNQTDAVLEQILFPKSKANTVKRMPDCFLQVKIPHFCKIFSPGTSGEFYVRNYHNQSHFHPHNIKFHLP